MKPLVLVERVPKTRGAGATPHRAATCPCIGTAGLTEPQVDGDARAVTLALLAARTPGATICPSEVARLLARTAGPAAETGDWRARMPRVHAAVDDLAAAGLVTLSWKGAALPIRAGPYRIGRGGRD